MERIKLFGGKGALTCPSCSARLDGATPLEPGTSPEIGSVTICAYCGEICEFIENFILAPVSDEVWDEVENEDRILLHRIQHKIRNKLL